MGDAVYSLLVREYLAGKHSADSLHNAAVEYVSAAAQARAFALIKPYLTEEETAIFNRGRNFHTNNTPKSSSHADYHTATGLEALFGFLHLSGQTERIKELFKIITENR
ncbi:MAG: ribonuclease III [Clostridia bacterium]|nr:ribonuclease III [Clostridia bacterium]